MAAPVLAVLPGFPLRRHVSAAQPEGDLVASFARRREHAPAGGRGQGHEIGRGQQAS